MRIKTWLPRLLAILVVPVVACSSAPDESEAPSSSSETPLIAFKACDPAAGVTPSDNAIATQLVGQMNGPQLRGVLNGYNVSCARMIARSAQNRGLAARAAVIAVTTAITESRLHNYTEAVDHDSLGLFQQRPSQGWGTPAQVTDAVYATNKFLDVMLAKYPNNAWTSGAIGPICQAVQRSAFPDRYERDVHDAQLLVDAILQSEPAATPRIGILQNGVVNIKEGNLYADWFDEQVNGIQDLQLSGDRIGVLTAEGSALVKEGPLDASWHDQAPHLKAFRLAGNRLGILTTAGTVFIKEGALNGDWLDEQVSGVQDLQLSGNRIGILTAEGEALVKEGPWDAEWHPEMPHIKTLRLSGNRIGVLTTAGTVFIKEGGLDDQWLDEQVSGVQDLQLSGNRIGILTAEGEALVKEGPWDAEWQPEMPDVKTLRLSPNRIGVVTTAGTVFIKEGGLAENWVDQLVTNVSSLEMTQ